MVHLTLEMLHRGFANHNQPQEIDHLRKITHLQVSGRDIESVDSDIFATCRSLTVVYLYDNRLESVPSFKNVNSVNLTHLYLQNNAICRITGLEILKGLVKLFLGGNQLTVIEGLEHCSQLEELHVERQHLPPGHRLVFDPQTVAALAQCLSILDVSGNKLASLVPFSPLVQLRELIAPGNSIEEFRETGALLEKSWRRIEILDLTGNPICQRNKYRERIIYLASPLLKQIDGKEVTEAQRKFVQGWHQAARGKLHDEKNKTPTKQALTRDVREARFQNHGSLWQTPQTSAILQSEATSLRLHSETTLGTKYVIPAMPIRNAIKHQSNPKQRGTTSNNPSLFTPFAGMYRNDIPELSRQFEGNASLSAKL